MNTLSGTHCLCPQHLTGNHCQRGEETLRTRAGVLGDGGNPGPAEEVAGYQETWHGPRLS